MKATRKQEQEERSMRPVQRRLEAFKEEFNESCQVLCRLGKNTGINKIDSFLLFLIILILYYFI